MRSMKECSFLTVKILRSLLSTCAIYNATPIVSRKFVGAGAGSRRSQRFYTPSLVLFVLSIARFPPTAASSIFSTPGIRSS
jgi:hypothetical protein